MKVVADANVVISALVKSSITREVLLYPYIEYYSPDFLLEELNEHKEELLDKVVNYDSAFRLIMTNVKVMPLAFYESSMKDAHKAIGNIDNDDEAYIALAMSLEADGIWSYDPHFKKQNKIPIFSTKDLALLIKSGIV